MKTWINKRRINLGATQAQIFKSIICNYYNNNFRSIDEYDFLLILSHTYQCFRSIRSTEAEEEIPLDTPLIKTFINRNFTNRICSKHTSILSNSYIAFDYGISQKSSRHYFYIAYDNGTVSYQPYCEQ
mgnify:CR=1 FL=1